MRKKSIENRKQIYTETPSRQGSKVNIYSNGNRQWQAVVETINRKKGQFRKITLVVKVFRVKWLSGLQFKWNFFSGRRWIYFKLILPRFLHAHTIICAHWQLCRSVAIKIKSKICGINHQSNKLNRKLYVFGIR